jgi:hypothetical protein
LEDHGSTFHFPSVTLIRMSCPDARS